MTVSAPKSTFCSSEGAFYVDGDFIKKYILFPHLWSANLFRILPLRFAAIPLTENVWHFFVCRHSHEKQLFFSVQGQYARKEMQYAKLRI